MSEEMKMRQIKALKLSDTLPSSMLSSDEKPKLEWLSPTELYVEEKYQRNLTRSSLKLINAIVEKFSWQKFKPPICAYGMGGKLFIVDGQHTAIAAATHPKITKIPVMIVDAASARNRAEAFIGHNRERLNVTYAQLYYSALAAEDPIALIVHRAMDATGCRILRSAPPAYVEGQTLAAGALMHIAKRRGEKSLTHLLKILIDAKRAPIVTNELKAVDMLLWDKDLRGRFDDEDLVDVIRDKTPTQWESLAEATVRKGQGMSIYKAVAIAWFRRVPKKRVKAADRVKPTT